MTIELSKEALLSLLKGKAPQAEKIQFRGAEFDSREIKGGELFVALKGDQTHGHSFLPQVFSRGAALALVEDEALLTNADPDWRNRLVYVPDTLKAFQTLATWWRNELGVPVLSITGSVGKTTVKEMTASILLRHSRGVYSLKSHNNHVGVPYTLLRLGREHGWAVIETGMNHRGEIAPLSNIAAPNVALVTCIAPAHIGNMGGMEAIADEKLDIAIGLLPEGILILNGGDPELKSGLARRKESHPVRYFGEGGISSAKISKLVSRGLEGISFELRLDDKAPLSVAMSVVGLHNATNAAAAALAAKTLLPSLTAEQIKAGLEQFRAPLMRLAIKELADGQRIIDDSYNANPASMAASIELASDLAKPKLKLGLILGDMLELGSYAAKYHDEIGAVAARSGAAFLVTVGTEAARYAPPCRSTNMQVMEAASPEAAAHIARKLGFDILLVKGSRGVGLEAAVKILTSDLGAP